MSQGLSAERLIAATRREGYEVTRDQLKRWHREGLIRRPTEQMYPRGTRGSAAPYPPGTLEQLLLVCRLHRKERRLDELRFDVWWEDGWIDPVWLRRSLGALLDAPLEPLRAHARAFADPHEAALAFIERPAESSSSSRSPVARLLRKRLDRDDRREQTASVALLTILFGGEPAWETLDVDLEDPEGHPIDDLLAMFGMGRATSDLLDSDEPLLSQRLDMPDVLAHMRESGLFDFCPSERLAATSDEDLERALRNGQDFAVLLVFSELAEYRHGRDAAGLGIFTALEREDERYARAIFVWLALCSADLLKGALPAENLAVMREHGPKLRAQRELLRAFPGYRSFLTFGGDQRLKQLPDEEQQQISRSLNEYLKHHPELQAILDEPGTID